MADKTVDYYFTITSPWSFLGHRPFLDLAKATGWDVAYYPTDFGQVFPQSGGLPLPKRPYQRRRYRMFELQRWRDVRGVPLNLRPKHFPTDAGLGHRVILAAMATGADPADLIEAMMRACWVEEADVGEAATLARVAGRLGFDGDALLADAGTEAGKARAQAATDRAIAENVFGAPTYVVAGEPFWGQDRLDLVARALKGEAGPYKVEEPV